MRRPRGKIESLPGDGWIKLAPGESFGMHIDQPMKPSYGELLMWMRDIRGGVLSASFGIENELVLMALADEFGSNDHGSVDSEYFEREQSYREENNLQRKITRAKPIIRRLREQPVADEIIRKLADYRELRNLLAHYPSWFEPVNEPGKTFSVDLKLFMADRNHVWEIDSAQAMEWDHLLRFVRISVENVRREIVGAPPLNPDGTPPSAQSTPIENLPA
jgi:hypothetical protein